MFIHLCALSSIYKYFAYLVIYLQRVGIILISHAMNSQGNGEYKEGVHEHTTTNDGHEGKIQTAEGGQPIVMPYQQDNIANAGQYLDQQYNSIQHPSVMCAYPHHMRQSCVALLEPRTMPFSSIPVEVMQNPNVYRNAINFTTESSQYPHYFHQNPAWNRCPPQYYARHASALDNSNPVLYYYPHQANVLPLYSSFNSCVSQSESQITESDSSNLLSPPVGSCVHQYGQAFSQEGTVPQAANSVNEPNISCFAPLTSTSTSASPPQQQHNATTSKNNATVQDIRSVLHLTTAQAAKQLGMNMAAFRKACRDNNIKAWPHRQIQGLQNRLHSLEQFVSALGKSSRHDSITNIDETREAYTDQIRSLKAHIEDIKDQAFSSVSKNNEKVLNPPATDDHSTLIATGKTASFLSTRVDNKHQSCLNVIKKKRKRRDDTTYDQRTGWIANCSKCGKVGKYRHPSAGRGFQHTSGGKYCGYYLINPRREEEDVDITCEQKST